MRAGRAILSNPQVAFFDKNFGSFSGYFDNSFSLLVDFFCKFCKLANAYSKVRCAFANQTRAAALETIIVILSYRNASFFLPYRYCRFFFSWE